MQPKKVLCNLVILAILVASIVSPAYGQMPDLSRSTISRPAGSSATPKTLDPRGELPGTAPKSGLTPVTPMSETERYVPLSPKPSPSSSNTAGSGSGRPVVTVDLSTQTCRFTDAGRGIDLTFGISSGTPRFPTPTGNFEVVRRGSLDGKSSTRISSEFGVSMPFALEISAKDINGTLRGICIHEGRIPNYPSSHACIRLAERNAKYLYEKCSVGTKVVIKGSEKDFIVDKFEYRNLLERRGESLRFKRNSDGTLTKDFLRAYDQKILKLCTLERGKENKTTDDKADWVIGWPFLDRYTECVPALEYEKQTGRKVFPIKK